jgi:hypothetical protein
VAKRKPEPLEYRVSAQNMWVEVRSGQRNFQKVLEMPLLVFGYALELVGAPFGPLFVVRG